MAKVINVVYGGNTYPITIDAPTEEEVAKKPGSFTIINGKHYLIKVNDQPVSLTVSPSAASKDSVERTDANKSTTSSPAVSPVVSPAVSPVVSPAVSPAVSNSSSSTAALVTATTSSSPTSASSAVRAMNLSSKTSRPLISIENRIKQNPNTPTRGTPPTMNRINEVNNSPNAIAREEAKEEANAKEKENRIPSRKMNMLKQIEQKRSSMRLLKLPKEY